MRLSAKVVLRAIEKALLVVVVGCGAYAASFAGRATAAQGTANSIVTRGPDSRGVDVDTVSVVAKEEPPSAGPAPAHVMGRLSIPDLKLVVPIMSDYETGSLLRGVGHIPGTALPGGLGTIGLAGHRDTYLRPLRGIRFAMDIQVGDRTGIYHYSVDSTEIVTPDAVRVLDIGSRPALTLITCYPFNYIGAAPERFIVHAHLVSALADGY